jgi:hypothetical protein
MNLTDPSYRLKMAKPCTNCENLWYWQLPKWKKEMEMKRTAQTSEGIGPCCDPC